jgi:hypothetical protein
MGLDVTYGDHIPTSCSLPSLLTATAIWDNRCTFHSATYDHEGYGIREGYRACGVGERPYLDPNSTGRREAWQS